MAKLRFIAFAIAGSFCVYCGQTATHGTDAVVGDARGDGGTCTQPPPSFTKLAEANFPTTGQSAPISVGAYREVIVYVVGATCPISDLARVSFRADASSPFGQTGQIVPVNDSNAGTRLRVDGIDLVFSAITPNDASCHYVVAGVQ